MAGATQRRRRRGSLSRPDLFEPEEEEPAARLTEPLADRHHWNLMDRAAWLAGLYAVLTDLDHPMPIHTLQGAIDFLEPDQVPLVAAFVFEVLQWPRDGAR